MSESGHRRAELLLESDYAKSISVENPYDRAAHIGRQPSLFCASGQIYRGGAEQPGLQNDVVQYG